MVIVTGYQNIYRSGYYHRMGKPNAFDRHSGDIYPTKAAALAEINPYSHYIATVAVVWNEIEQLKINPTDSVPVSLRESRLNNYPLSQIQEDSHEKRSLKN